VLSHGFAQKILVSCFIGNLDDDVLIFDILDVLLCRG